MDLSPSCNELEQPPAQVAPPEGYFLYSRLENMCVPTTLPQHEGGITHTQTTSVHTFLMSCNTSKCHFSPGFLPILVIYYGKRSHF